MKKILVLLSAYNGERFIESQMQSIMAQNTESDIFLRVRDDGSTDNTVKIVKKFAGKYPGHVELIEGENVGFNASFISLINSAEGYDYYALSDQDDVWLPDKIESAIRALDSQPEELPLLYSCISTMVREDLTPCGETRRLRHPFEFTNTAVQNICPGHNQVLNNALLRRLKTNIDPSKLYVYDMWIANTAVLYGRILFENIPHTLYRQHGRNELGTRSSRIGKLIKAAQRVYAGDGQKCKRQLAYFLEVNRAELRRQGYVLEIERFLTAKSLKKRLSYALYGRFHRQSCMETIALKIAILLGQY